MDWDDEIIAVQTDAAAGADPTVWRFAHHRSDIHNDLDATRAKTIAVMPIPSEGLGEAINDRLRRAAVERDFRKPREQ